MLVWAAEVSDAGARVLLSTLEGQYVLTLLVLLAVV
jgi:hypothetical protein